MVILSKRASPSKPIGKEREVAYRGMVIRYNAYGLNIWYGTMYKALERGMGTQ